jgi:hypothetical protein
LFQVFPDLLVFVEHANRSLARDMPRSTVTRVRVTLPSPGQIPRSRN